MINLNNLVKGGTLCFCKAGLAKGSGNVAAKILTPDGEGIMFAIKGILYHKADADDAVAFTGITQAAERTGLYLVCLNSTGTVSVVAGTPVATASLTNGSAVLQWPVPSDTVCPIGAIKIVTAAATTFTGATTHLDATGVTSTYYDLFTIPVAPLTS